MRPKRLGAILTTAALTATGIVAASSPAAAATITVTTADDVVDGTDGLTSLREAFITASASAAADTIVLDATTYDLTDCAVGEVVDAGTGDLTVEGNGATIHQTCDDTRVVGKTQLTGTLTLGTSTLTGAGNSGPAVAGGAVLSAGHLVLDHVTVTNIANPDFGTVVEFANSAALYDAEIIDSTITGNGGRAVDNTSIGGGVHVVGSTITENTGGGIDLVDGTPMVVETSTVSGNGGYGVKTTGQGSTSLTVTSSTVSSNTNAGVSCGACDDVSVTSSIVTGNGIGAGPGGGGGISVTTDQDDASDAPVITVTDTTVSGNNAERDGGGLTVSWIEAHDATEAVHTTVTGSTFDDNHAECAGCDGGAISVDVGSLAVDATEITDNITTGDGGGIAQDRRNGDSIAAPTTFALTDSAVSGNEAGADGGGVSAHAATLDVARTLVEGNEAPIGGGLALGGIFITDAVQSGDATITESTLTGNTATVHGGGLTLRFPDGSHATLVNSTVHANTAPVGGGIAAGLTEPLTLRYTTVTGNSAPTGANLASSSLTTIGASVLAEPAGGGTDCAAFPGFGTNFVSEGYSWFSDATCNAGPTDVVAAGGDPLLGALGSNGGPTPTRLPELASPLGGLVPAASCTVPTDQRGEARPAGVDCEPGAVEIEETTSLILGTSGSDLLLGTPADDEIQGLAGRDLLIGGAGDDLLLGGSGNDLLIGGPGDDILRGGSGNDLLIGGPGHDTYDGGSGFDLCLLPGHILPKVC